MGTVFVLSLSLLASGVLRGVGDSRTPMLISAGANVINVIVSYGLIFGELGMPELGAVGSAWGTFIARALGFAALFFVMWRGVRGVSIRGAAGWAPHFELARQILRIGIPAATEQMLNSVAFLSLSIVIAQLGTLALAAHRIALNAMSLSFLPGLGFAMAATALVGQSVGAKRYREGQAVATIATRWAMVWMGLLGVVFFFFPDLVLRVFTDDPVVISQGAGALRAIAITQPLWAINMVQSGALRGTGDSQYPLRVGTSSIWAAVILGAVLATVLDAGLPVIWSAFLVTSPVAAILFTRRFRRTIERLDAAAP
jgi:putative MATE family efflux protein